MKMNYYDILKVTSKATEDELKRAYKKLAMRWHPDKHPSGTKGLAEAKFKQICEAYDVLSDMQKRQIYDLYGEDGLKYNVSSPSAAAVPRGSSKGNSFKYSNSRHHHVSDDFFDDFFTDGGGSDRSRSPKSDSYDFATAVKNNYEQSNLNNAKEDTNKKGENYEKVKKYSRSSSTMERKKAAPVENKLVCSLEELYKGSKRKMKIARLLSDDSGKPIPVDEVLAIDIRPGWKKGTKITFPEKGNQEAGLVPGDLIFVIDEKPHPTFKRDGNDLVFSHKLSLLEALTGKTVSLTTLDGRNLNIEVSDVVKPGHEVVITGEGMPISKDPKTRGNLRIKFDIKFPSRLSGDQKADLRRVLSRSS